MAESMIPSSLIRTDWDDRDRRHRRVQGRYEEALAEAERCHSEGFPWSPQCRAAALGQLGRTVEAADELRRLLALIPESVSSP